MGGWICVQGIAYSLIMCLGWLNARIQSRTKTGHVCNGHVVVFLQVNERSCNGNSTCMVMRVCGSVFV